MTPKTGQSRKRDQDVAFTPKTTVMGMVRIMLALTLAGALPLIAQAAPFAAFVMDARSGKQIYAQNADTPLHPASLTKMMTLYVAFGAIERGEVRLDSKFLVSSHAASQPPSRLGLKAGQYIELRYLIRAAAVKSANDAATTIAEGLGGGSESRFAARMNATARALGMRNTNFVNANGLSTSGHYSSARDMTTLGRRLFYDFPQYYGIFSRRTADAGIATVRSTNRKFLDAYEGADGIKTGYTRAAGFNLTASAQRGSKRIVATVMGGTSTAHRNAVMAQLLDAGFGRAPMTTTPITPAMPGGVRKRSIQIAPRISAAPPSPAPQPKLAKTPPVATPAPPIATLPPAATAVAAIAASDSPRPRARPARLAAAASQTAPIPEPADQMVKATVAKASIAGVDGSKRPRQRVEQGSDDDTAQAPSVTTTTQRPDGSARPKARGAAVIIASLDAPAADRPPTVKLSRSAGQSGRGYGIALGYYKSKGEADAALVATALSQSGTLQKANRHVANTAKGFQPSFAGLSKSAAQLTCQRLSARKQTCRVIGK